MSLFYIIRRYFADLVSFVTSHCPDDGNIIVKTTACGNDVQFKNDKHCAYDKNNWRLTVTTILLRHFGELRPV